VTPITESEVTFPRAPLKRAADIEKLRIRAAPETFLKHRLHVVSSITKQRHSVSRKILVQLEPNGHPPGYAGIGTIRSRARSAA
jgi:hypothetical protein